MRARSPMIASTLSSLARSYGRSASGRKGFDELASGTRRRAKASTQGDLVRRVADIPFVLLGQ